MDILNSVPSSARPGTVVACHCLSSCRTTKLLFGAQFATRDSRGEGEREREGTGGGVEGWVGGVGWRGGGGVGSANCGFNACPRHGDCTVYCHLCVKYI